MNPSPLSSTRLTPLSHVVLSPLGALSPQAPHEMEIERRDSQNATPTHRVILYDDDWHTPDEVVVQIQKATGYDLYKSTAIMLEAHTRGRAICFRGDRVRCHDVAGVLRQIRLQVEVDCD